MSDTSLTTRTAWWLHPLWALTLLTGTSAILSITLSNGAFHNWGTHKYLDQGLGLVLMLQLGLMASGVMLGSGLGRRPTSCRLRVSDTQLATMTRAYRATFILTLLGYAMWAATAASQGVSLGDLQAVLAREQQAIGDLKANARPVAGLTTLTQFGPVSVALGCLLHKLGRPSRRYWWLVAFAAVRATFYAERLALIEVLLPLIVVAALTSEPGSRKYNWVRLGPLLAAPLLWLVFATSEYGRSWVFYQHETTSSFPAWVTLRLVGYYVTSFNNSALFASAYGEIVHQPIPYFSFGAVWNAPILTSLIERPQFQGASPETWWSFKLATASNPEFTNMGSFLKTYAELGLPVSSALWLVIGLAIGLIFAAARGGSLAGLVAYASIFVGILELPRLVYWFEGRATPILVGLVLLALSLRKRQNRRPRPSRPVKQTAKPPPQYRDVLECSLE